jgi:chromosome segregation protein
MIAGAVAEGFGILMIVPLVAFAMDGASVPQQLQPLLQLTSGLTRAERFLLALGLFVAAMALRSILLFARDMLTMRLDAALATDIAREQALQGDAARAIGALDEERSAIEQRLEDAEGQAARIAAELTALEGRSREAETKLAELLARQAAMKAERRVAEAALEAARAQAARAEREADGLAAQLNSFGDGSDHAAARDQARARAEHAGAAVAAGEEQRIAADEGRASAAEHRDAAESSLAGARASLAAAQSEHHALSLALDHGGGAAIASLAAEPGYERALAAALGEDADAAIGGDGQRRWSGSGIDPADPPLAAGLRPLSDFARAPEELARRLRQIGVADRDEGQPLAVGQRLVTRDGRVRRWDGFISEGAGAAAAERLIRANRRTELARQLAPLEAQVAAATQGRDEAAAKVERFRGLAEQARTAIVTAERESRESTRMADAAAAALERLEAQRSSIAQRQADLAPVKTAATESVQAAELALAALPDPAALQDELDRARLQAGAAGSAVADKRAEAATRARETASARERHSAAAREQSEWRRRQKDAETRLADGKERQQAQAAEREQLAAEPEPLDVEIAELERGNALGEQEAADAVAAEREAERVLAEAGAGLANANEALASAREQRAAAAARAEAQEARRTEYARICVEKFECVPQRLSETIGFDPAGVADPDSESATLEKLTADRERIGPVNLVAEQELAEIEESRVKGAEESEELTQAIHRLRGSIGSLNREGRTRLLEAFEQVNGHFRSLFTTLFDGGQAHLELVESDDPLEAGLEIMAQPPGKRLSTLTLLSGGEQALTAVALIFGLFLTNPAPICVLDEVDAPLDDANVERFCDLLVRMTQETDTRYLIVTHNAVTMSRMNRLYGVTMVEKGVSRLVSVDLGSAETLLAAE